MLVSLLLPGTAMMCALVLCGTSPRAADLAVRLVDVAQQAGITLLNICGGPDKDYLVDEVGSGAAWLAPHFSELFLLSSGRSIDIYKDIGHPKGVAECHPIGDLPRGRAAECRSVARA